MADFSQREKSIFLQLFPELPKSKLASIPLPQKKGSNEDKKLVYCFKYDDVGRRGDDGSLYSIVQVLPNSVKEHIECFIDNHFKKIDLSQEELKDALVHECIDNLKNFKKDKKHRKEILKEIFNSRFKFKKSIPHKHFFIAVTLFQVKEYNLFSENFSKEKIRTLIEKYYTDKEVFLEKYWKLLQAMEKINYLSEVCYKHKHFCFEDNLRFSYSKKGKELLANGKRVFELFLSENEKLKDDSDPVSQAKVQSAKVLSRKEVEKRERRKPKLITNKGVTRYKTDPEISKFVLDDVDYECQYDNDHKTFTSGKDVCYTEAHHLIPMSMQGEKNLKSKNIDIEANIVSLCPNCHRAVHLGNKEEKEKRLGKLYDKKANELKEASLCYSFQELISYYQRKKPRAPRPVT